MSKQRIIIYGSYTDSELRKKVFTSLTLQSFTEQSSLPLTNFVGSDGEKSTDQALF